MTFDVTHLFSIRILDARQKFNKSCKIRPELRSTGPSMMPLYDRAIFRRGGEHGVQESEGKREASTGERWVSMGEHGVSMG